MGLRFETLSYPIFQIFHHSHAYAFESKSRVLNTVGSRPLVSLNRSTNIYLLCNTSLVMLPCYYLYPMTITVIIEKPPGDGPHRPHEPNDNNQHLERVRVPQDLQPQWPHSSTKSQPGTQKTNVWSGTGLNFRTWPILDSEAISMRNWPGLKKYRQNTCGGTNAIHTLRVVQGTWTWSSVFSTNGKRGRVIVEMQGSRRIESMQHSLWGAPLTLCPWFKTSVQRLSMSGICEWDTNWCCFQVEYDMSQDKNRIFQSCTVVLPRSWPMFFEKIELWCH